MHPQCRPLRPTFPPRSLFRQAISYSNLVSNLKSVKCIPRATQSEAVRESIIENVRQELATE